MGSFPGGKLKEGETPLDCAVREAHEETGLNPRIIEAWPPIQIEYRDRSVLLHPFLAKLDPGDRVRGALDMGAYRRA